MNFLSGVYQIAKESILHPLSGSQLVQTPSGSYIPIRPGVDLSHQIIENYDLSGVNFQKVNLDGTMFVNCNLDGADFTGAKITPTTKFELTPIQNAIGIPQEKTS